MADEFVIEIKNVGRARGHGMELLTEEMRKQLPPLGGQDGKGGAAIAHAKFFTPDGAWTWYATEFSPQEGLFCGLVDGLCKELGYFALAELESVTGPLGLHIERDTYWTPTRLGDIAPELFGGASKKPARQEEPAGR